MSKYLFVTGFLFFVFLPKVLHSQQLIYESKKELDYYFDKSDAANEAVFALLGDNLSAGAYFKYQLSVQTEVYKQQNGYSVKIKTVRNDVVCRYRYKGFLLNDFIVADRISVQGNITGSQTSLLYFDIKEKEISSSDVILDTVLLSEGEWSSFHFAVSDIRLFMGEKAIVHLKEGLKKIDNFSRYDSLHADWQMRMAQIDLSNIDMIPVYRFRIDDLEQELLLYDKNEYEVLLGRSGKDNQDYLHKRSILFNKVEELKLDLSKKMAEMDALMYREGKRFEEEGDFEKAIFYYNRALDYNPSHCEALEKLSEIYIHNNLHQQNLELFTGLKMRGADIVCESTLASSVCDSMCMKVSSLIVKRNYYDAMKFLDTLEQLLFQVSDTSYMRIYHNLKKQAQEGIYDSYFEVIGRSIRNNKLELGKEYIYGLSDIMRQGGDEPSKNDKYMQMMNRYLASYGEKVRQNAGNRNYAAVISDNDKMIVFLDSVLYPYDKKMFEDSYTASHTAVYFEKKKYSELEASDYYATYSRYISATDRLPDNIADATDVANSPHHLLAKAILRWNNTRTDFSILDTLWEFYQTDNRYVFSYDTIVFPQAIRIVSETVSKINQHAWGNELLQANTLIGKIEHIVPFLRLRQTDFVLFQRYNQTKELVYHRFTQQAESEYNALVAKVKQFAEAKDYMLAYALLKKGNVFLEQTVYMAHVDRLTEQVRIPAVFQYKMLMVEQNLALGDFIQGFMLYEDAYNYFAENNISQYDLVCDSLPVFIKSRNKKEFLQSAIVYYMNENKYMNALDVMFYTVDLGYSDKDLQMKLGKKMKSAAYSLHSLTEKYTFSQAHKPFLEGFIGKSKAFWYLKANQKKAEQ
ncbi:MAG: hypothetical protein LBH82_03025 [Bacteroidales bacterium]|jgi:hypothetical protein|nr:hypothetical protein [Bacteroidales bacterium]